mmetsp:Transcript_16329/g.37672  ORF Transcript_16329/g.37672 Transcript_16329/m.37672 type:complete len:131 (-) Transcript_16329:20-412(-)
MWTKSCGSCSTSSTESSKGSAFPGFSSEQSALWRYRGRSQSRSNASGKQQADRGAPKRRDDHAERLAELKGRMRSHVRGFSSSWAAFSEVACEASHDFADVSMVRREVEAARAIAHDEWVDETGSTVISL